MCDPRRFGFLQDAVMDDECYFEVEEAPDFVGKDFVDEHEGGDSHWV